jgi:hypothetical protein
VGGTLLNLTSAEDAEYLAEELGGGLNKQDLLELGHYQCYARITDVRNSERLPAFSMRLDAPPASDAAIAGPLAAASAERYGRNVLDVELDLQAAAERIRTSSAMTQAAQENQPPSAAANGGTGSPSSTRTPAGGQVPRRRRADTPRKTSSKTSRQERGTKHDVGVEGAERREDPAA